MLLNKFEMDKSLVAGVHNGKDTIFHCVTLSCYVVIKRDKKTYEVPLVQIYEYPEENYTVDALECAMLSYFKWASEISKKWKIVTEDITNVEGGKVITQREFDITRDI